MSTNGLPGSAEARDWPNRRDQPFRAGGGLRWHVQVMGRRSAAGAAGARHRRRDAFLARPAPLLARRFTVVAPDLPGHGFTDEPRSGGLSLPGMARALDALLEALEVKPGVAVGHSAGAAVMAKLWRSTAALRRRALVGLNGALLPFPAACRRRSSPPSPGCCSSTPSRRACSPGWPPTAASVERLLRDTGSRIDARGLELYARLFRQPGHVAGALGMMANWDLKALARDLPKLRTPTLLIVGGQRQGDPAGGLRKSRQDLARRAARNPERPRSPRA